MTDRRDEVERIVRAQVEKALRPRREDVEFLARLRERIDADRPVLDRLRFGEPGDPIKCDRCGKPPTHLTPSGFRLCPEHAAAVSVATPFDFTAHPAPEGTEQ